MASMLTTDLRKLLNDTGTAETEDSPATGGPSWPVEVIAEQTKVPVEEIEAYLKDGLGISTEHFERLNNWADRHRGISGIGVPTFATYSGSVKMGTCIAVSADELPRGAKYEPGSINAGLRIVSEKGSKESVAKLLQHNGGSNAHGINGVGITISKAEQLVKKAS